MEVADREEAHNCGRHHHGNGDPAGHGGKLEEKRTKKSVIGRRLALHGILGCNSDGAFGWVFIFLSVFPFPLLIRPLLFGWRGISRRQDRRRRRVGRADVFCIVVMALHSGRFPPGMMMSMKMRADEGHDLYA